MILECSVVNKLAHKLPPLFCSSKLLVPLVQLHLGGLFMWSDRRPPVGFMHNINTNSYISFIHSIGVCLANQVGPYDVVYSTVGMLPC